MAAKEKSPVRVRRIELGLSLRECARLLGIDVVKLGEVERGLGILTASQRDALDRLEKKR